jgi:serine/threonine-protein kinase
LQILAALEAAHGAGIVHREIKPANIMLTDGVRVKVTDFGIARLDASNLTQHDAMIGTPSYMSPEQCRGETVDGRSDLFSAGVVLFEMLSGQKPFPGRSPAEVLSNLLHQPAPDVADLVPGVQGAGAALCDGRGDGASLAGRAVGRCDRARRRHGARLASRDRFKRAAPAPQTASHFDAELLGVRCRVS